MEFLPPEEFDHRMAAAFAARVDELVALGVARMEARFQAVQEYSMYDRIECDPATGWVRIHGLELPPVPDGVVEVPGRAPFDPTILDDWAVECVQYDPFSLRPLFPRRPRPVTNDPPED